MVKEMRLDRSVLHHDALQNAGEVQWKAL